MGHWSDGQKEHRSKMKSARQARALEENKKREARLAELKKEKLNGG